MRGALEGHKLIPLIFWLGLLLAWELGGDAGVVSRLFFPPPSAIARTLVARILDGQLVEATGATLGRLVLGVIAGGGLGLLVGLWLGWSSTARAVAGPLLAAVHPLPKVALLPLVLIIFGIGEESKIVLVALAAFFPMLINSIAGVRQVDDLTWEVARHYGARGWTLVRRVIVPGSLPMVLAGVQLALNAGLMVTVAVEMVTAKRGLGATIWLAWQTLRTTELYAALSVIAALGVVGNALLGAMSRWLVPWQRKDEAESGSH